MTDGAVSTIWAPPPSGHDNTGNWDAWAELGQSLADHDIVAARTTTIRATHWADAVRAERAALSGLALPWRAGKPVPNLNYIDAICAVRAGLAIKDLYTASRTHRMVSGNGRPNSTALSLVSTANAVLSYLSMRALIGWVSAESAMTDTENRYQHVHDWAAAGIGEDGWLYAAAGFTLDEALTAKVDGTLDPGQARLMAALRGVSLPVE